MFMYLLTIGLSGWPLEEPGRLVHMVEEQPVEPVPVVVPPEPLPAWPRRLVVYPAESEVLPLVIDEPRVPQVVVEGVSPAHRRWREPERPCHVDEQPWRDRGVFRHGCRERGPRTSPFVSVSLTVPFWRQFVFVELKIKDLGHPVHGF